MRLRRLVATFALLLVAGTANAAPAWSATAPAALADAAPTDLLARLDSGQSAVVTLLGDSTGDEDDEWFHALAVWLARLNPGHHTTYQAWSDRDKAYGDAADLGGSAGSGPSLAIYNGSVAGKSADYALGQLAKLTEQPSDLYVINYSHNKGAVATYPEYATLAGELRAEHPAAGIVPVLQNPEDGPGKTEEQIAAHAQRIQIIRTLAGDNRWPVIDAWNAFRADPRPLDELLLDGIHPTPAGQSIWLAVAQRVFLDQSAQGNWTDCPTGTPATGGYLCLWDNTNYDNGHLRRSYETLRNTRTAGILGCWNLTGSSYSSGFSAYDSASSWALRKNPDSATRYQVQIFDWINCNTEGNSRTYVVDQDYAAADLRTIGWNNTAASVRVTLAP
ncbi:GDSL-type esterase/lipase family protein [Actinoplanes sp. TRM 88003]|uniref:GDSL-type esterase/lipase family protein n=1 Tax=Paractinoplanes aksuensis TaxID=2939490 RepID=A0ABT1E1L2_9ACTN|nr:GDSL-type esterase/lipase family protein [Actinoplanes aksuensis]MCO8276156.1 GDSL-type esterase/lipase family protein [Actinoplanes aksuensis]